MQRPTLKLRVKRQVLITIEEFDEIVDEPSMEHEPYTVLVRKIEALARERQITESFAERVIFGLMK